MLLSSPRHQVDMKYPKSRSKELNASVSATAFLTAENLAKASAVGILDKVVIADSPEPENHHMDRNLLGCPRHEDGTRDDCERNSSLDYMKHTLRYVHGDYGDFVS